MKKMTYDEFQKLWWDSLNKDLTQEEELILDSECKERNVWNMYKFLKERENGKS